MVVRRLDAKLRQATQVTTILTESLFTLRASSDFWRGHRFATAFPPAGLGIDRCRHAPAAVGLTDSLA